VIWAHFRRFQTLRVWRRKPGFPGFRFAPFFALCAKNAQTRRVWRPSNPLRGYKPANINFLRPAPKKAAALFWGGDCCRSDLPEDSAGLSPSGKVSGIEIVVRQIVIRSDSGIFISAESVDPMAFSALTSWSASASCDSLYFQKYITLILFYKKTFPSFPEVSAYRAELSCP
jgi:hypothetical protein